MIPSTWRVGRVGHDHPDAGSVAAGLGEMSWAAYSLGLYLNRDRIVQRWIDQVTFVNASEVKRRFSLDIEIDKPEEIDLAFLGHQSTYYEPTKIDMDRDLVLPLSHQVKQALKGFSLSYSAMGEDELPGRVPPSSYTNSISALWMGILVSSLDSSGGTVFVDESTYGTFEMIATLPQKRAIAHFDHMFGSDTKHLHGRALQVWHFCRSFATGFPLLALMPMKTDSVLVKIEMCESLVVPKFRGVHDLICDRARYRFDTPELESDCGSYHCEILAPDGCEVSQIVASRRAGGEDHSTLLATSQAHFHLPFNEAPMGAHMFVTIAANASLRAQMLITQAISLLIVMALTFAGIKHGDPGLIESSYFLPDVRVVLITVLLASTAALLVTSWRHELTESISSGTKANALLFVVASVVLAALATLWVGDDYQRLTNAWGLCMGVLIVSFLWTSVSISLSGIRNFKASKRDKTDGWFRAC